MIATALKLPATLEKFIAAQVEQGAYRSRQAAIVAAVAGEKRRVERRAWLTNAIQQGVDSRYAIAPLNMDEVIQRGRIAVRERRAKA